MASMTAIWWREGRQFVGLEATSGDADKTIRRVKGKSEGNNNVTKTLDKVTVTI